MSQIRKVLIIDDDEISNFICKNTILKNGFSNEVKTVLSANEGLEYLKGSGEIPDLVLLDINMPVLNGWDFLEEYKKIRESLEELPVVVMFSSSVHEADIEKARKDQDVQDYIIKPMTTDTLENIFNKHFSMKE